MPTRQRVSLFLTVFEVVTIAILSFIGNLWSNVWPYLIAILLFLLLITIHEFGHFLLAKLCGVQVNEFAIGFGPRLFKKKGKETEYSIRLIPFGGFCAMEGEDEASDNPRAFGNAKAWKRLLILLAGAGFNILLGVVLAVLLVATSSGIATTTVAKFDENAVSCNSGLEVGDEIVRANGRSVFTTYDLSYIMATDTDGVMDFVVRRDGKKVNLDGVKFDLTETENGQRLIQLDFYVRGEEKTFFSVIGHGVKTAMSYGRIVYMSLFDMLTGRYGLNDMSGPVGVTAVIGNAAKTSLPNFLSIACLIAINLGIMNLLPLPALDGGRVLFVLIEMVFRRPIPAKYEGLVHTIGFILLMGLILLITGNDIYKLITGKLI